MNWRQNLLSWLFNNWHIKALSLIVAVLIVYFNSISTLTERTLAIPLEVRLPASHLPAALLPSSVRIILRGEGDDIVNVVSEDINALLDLSGYQEAREYLASVQIVRTGEAVNVEPLEITSEPAQLLVRLEEQVTKEVEVVADIAGVLAVGYQLAETSLIPGTVVISGPQSVLGQVSRVSTQQINVNNHAASSTTRVELVAPGAYVTFPNGNSVDVVFELGEILIVRTVEGVVGRVDNLRDRFAAEYELNNTFVIARARPSVLNQLEEGGVVLVANADDISARGQYNLPLTPQIVEQLIPDVEIVDHQPKSLFLTVDTR